MNGSNEQVVTRMPPSPTGLIHVGNVRTLIFNYLFAKKHGGTIVFRSEDTDRVRSKREYEDANVHDLEWLGLSWDAFYRQSERTEIYQHYLDELLASDRAYRSREESKQEPGKIVEVIRLRNANKIIKFDDIVRGPISFDTTELGDFVIARTYEEPLYHLTVVVDDHEMGITHVIRGEDHISNTPRQILIQEAIGAARPHYAHVPLILASDRTKLSKRHGAVSIGEYREQGYLPEAIVNYLALLGWNPGTEQEIFALNELVEQFSLEHIQKGGAIFDATKFAWVNKEHLKKMDDATFQELIETVLPESVRSLPQYTKERLTKLLPTIRERVHTIGEAADAAGSGEFDFAFAPPTVPEGMLAWKKDTSPEAAHARLSHIVSLIESVNFDSAETIKEGIWPYVEQEGKGEVLWPLRVALTGKERSPDPFTVAYILGKTETKSRLSTVVK